MEGDETPSEAPGRRAVDPPPLGLGRRRLGSPSVGLAYAPPGCYLWHQRGTEAAPLPVIHVLVADDEFERAALAELLGQTSEQYAAGRRCGAVQLVPNGAAVRAAVVAHRELGATTGTRFDLVLLDVVLGVNETAADVVGWVREAAGTTVPIVLFSAGVQLELVRALPPPPSRHRAPRRPPPCRAPGAAPSARRRRAARPQHASRLTAPPPPSSAGAALHHARRRHVRDEAALAGFCRYLWQYHLRRDPSGTPASTSTLRPRRRRRRRASRRRFGRRASGRRHRPGARRPQRSARARRRSRRRNYVPTAMSLCGRSLETRAAGLPPRPPRAPLDAMPH